MSLMIHFQEKKLPSERTILNLMTMISHACVDLLIKFSLSSFQTINFIKCAHNTHNTTIKLELCLLTIS